MMAEAVAEGARTAGAEVALLTCAEFDGGMMGDYDAVALAARDGSRGAGRERI